MAIIQGVDHVHDSKSLQEWTKYLFPDELDELKRLTNLLPNNPIIVNFGAGNGTSAFCFLEARPGSRLITIDIQDKPSPFGCLAAEKKHLKAAGYWGLRDIEHIHGSSDKVGRRWLRDKRAKVDMVFVDGGHTAPQPEKDILAWLPNIKPGGIIAVHDYQKEMVFSKKTYASAPHPTPWEDVDEAVDRLLLGRYEKIGHVDSLIAFRIDK